MYLPTPPEGYSWKIIEHEDLPGAVKARSKHEMGVALSGANGDSEMVIWSPSMSLGTQFLERSCQELYVRLARKLRVQEAADAVAEANGRGGEQSTRNN